MLDAQSIRIRKQILDMVNIARRGHIGSAFSCIEILRVLYDSFLQVDPKLPTWKDRDRFILSKGHGCLALYAILAERGFFPKKELATFCAFDSILGGHPQYGKIPGLEASTGSLGHGLSIGLGMALALRLKFPISNFQFPIKSQIKKTKKENLQPITYNLQPRVVVLISDGECNEGSTWEAILCASKYKLPNLLILVDYNKMQSYASTLEVQDLEPFAQKWQSFGFTVSEVDGHDVPKLQKTIRSAWNDTKKPHVIICHTIKGKGVPFIEQNPAWHHKSKISDEEMERLYAELGKNSQVKSSTPIQSESNIKSSRGFPKR